MIGWVIARTGHAKERKLAKDFASFSITCVVPEQLTFKSISRHSPVRLAHRTLIAPRMVFVQAGFKTIKHIEYLANDTDYEVQGALDYHVGDAAGYGEIRKRLRNFEGWVLDDGQPYVIKHEPMQAFLNAIEASNALVQRYEDQAKAQLEGAKKTTWHNLAGVDIADKLKALLTARKET